MTVRTCISRLERIFESDELPPSEDTEGNEIHASKTLNGRVAQGHDVRHWANGGPTDPSLPTPRDLTRRRCMRSSTSGTGQ